MCAIQTKRDECVVLHGERLRLNCLQTRVSLSSKHNQKLQFYFLGPEAEECQKLIAAHKDCLRKEGFNVRQNAHIDLADLQSIMLPTVQVQ